MGKKFTEKAESALNRSVTLAEEFGHTYIGTEHFLLSLLYDKDSVASIILSKHKLTYEKLKNCIEEYSGVGVKSTLTVKDITPRARQILESSYSNAVKYGDGTIGTDHILLSTLEEKNSVAMKMLRILSVDAGEIQKEVLSQLKTKERNTVKFSSGSNTPTLNQYGKNLSEFAKTDAFDPVIGRDAETERVIRILCRKNKNNPCLIGEAGVGKTAIVEGLAKRIADGHVPYQLKKKSIISIDLTSMVAGAKYRGDFEERIKNIVSEAKRNKDVILFIDEIHTIVGAGAAEGAIDAANILKPELSRGEIQVIGATTFYEYHKYIEKDPALERRFQPIIIEEPTKDKTLEMLRGIRNKYEIYHKVTITDEALQKCVELSDRYIQDRYFPDKAIDLLDEACAYKSSYSCISNVISRQRFEEPYEIAEGYQSESDSTFTASPDETVKYAPVVDQDAIYAIISEIYGIEGKTLGDNLNFNDLEDALKERIFGQESAINSLVSAVKRCELGFTDIDRPRGVFLFSGESGVGKTALALCLAEALFNDNNSFIRLDMSEYSEPHSVSKLIGSPPGYVGNEEGGKLTEAIRRRTYSFILLDEIEKAHKDVINLFLQIFDYGQITDAQGRKINFKNCYIVMTTNIIMNNEKKRMGFISDTSFRNVENGPFSNELLNRIDEIICFENLNDNTLKKIAFSKIKAIKENLKKRNISIEISDDVLNFIVEKSKKKGIGARHIIRYIHKYIETPICDVVLNNESGKNYRVTPSLLNDRFEIRELSDTTV